MILFDVKISSKEYDERLYRSMHPLIPTMIYAYSKHDSMIRYSVCPKGKWNTIAYTDVFQCLRVLDAT